MQTPTTAETGSAISSIANLYAEMIKGQDAIRLRRLRKAHLAGTLAKSLHLLKAGDVPLASIEFDWVDLPWAKDWRARLRKTRNASGFIAAGATHTMHAEAIDKRVVEAIGRLEPKYLEKSSAWEPSVPGMRPLDPGYTGPKAPQVPYQDGPPVNPQVAMLGSGTAVTQSKAQIAFAAAALAERLRLTTSPRSVDRLVELITEELAQQKGGISIDAAMRSVMDRINSGTA